MAAGYIMDKNTINNNVGTVCREIDKDLATVESIKVWLDSQTDQDLIDLGFTSGDVANIKTAMNELKQLRDIYIGAVNLAVAKDFRVFPRRLQGIIMLT